MSCSLADEHAVIARSYYCLYNLPSEYAPGADSNRLPMHQSKTASYDNAMKLQVAKLVYLSSPGHGEHPRNMKNMQRTCSSCSRLSRRSVLLGRIERLTELRTSVSVDFSVFRSIVVMMLSHQGVTKHTLLFCLCLKGCIRCR